jgi:hypothetical protein
VRRVHDSNSALVSSNADAKGKPRNDAAKYVALELTRQLDIRKFGFSPKFRKRSFSREGGKRALSVLLQRRQNTSSNRVIDCPANSTQVDKCRKEFTAMRFTREQTQHSATALLTNRI